MSENKMLAAYRHLLEQAKESMIRADMKSWDLLGQAVEKVQQEESVLEQLTDKQLEQVQEDVKADIHKIAEYLNDFDKGVEEFIDMDLPVIEQYLEEKALSLADPTELMILRLRINAAMSTE
ncbi:zinc ribbon-containing protein [Hydrogenovibrio thermophilus]|uniref:Uncharacterized protein n=1 Tax=Hydrogenovibrio thermophilus TaxID=265883 RepID=A0A410H1B7_9GAMM|nr:hypothetical protein [Hydrogenovibrio thermophilus]QAB14709.1 hypothetical protein EPV75_02995 [Hydrogenovibrio thermophilus]